MIKIGLTGGIGSGKSTVANVFRVLGYPVYDSDAEAIKLINSDPKLIREIQNIFSINVYPNQKYDRKLVAKLVFSDKELLKKLNAVVHPSVALHFKEWCNLHQSATCVIKEAAILVESGAYKEMDFVISVTAPEKLRVKRVMKRDMTNMVDVTARIKTQISDQERKKVSDFIIVNDDKQMVLPQVITLNTEILKQMSQ